MPTPTKSQAAFICPYAQHNIVKQALLANITMSVLLHKTKHCRNSNTYQCYINGKNYVLKECKVVRVRQWILRHFQQRYSYVEARKKLVKAGILLLHTMTIISNAVCYLPMVCRGKWKNYYYYIIIIYYLFEWKVEKNIMESTKSI